MGLKSSSALLMAAVNALSTGNSVILTDNVIFNLISTIQTKAVVVSQEVEMISHALTFLLLG